MNGKPEIGDIWCYESYRDSIESLAVHDFYLITSVKDSWIDGYPWNTSLIWMGSDDPSIQEDTYVDDYLWPDDGFRWTKIA